MEKNGEDLEFGLDCTEETTHSEIPECEISFLEMAQQVVKRKTNVTFVTWYDSKGKTTNEYTFGKLWEEAGLISYYLRNKWGTNKGDRVVLCYNFGLHFLPSFLGCLRAGVTAVVVYPPFPPLTTSLRKMMYVVDDCGPVLILTDYKVNLVRMADTTNPFSRTKSLWPKNVSWRVTEKLSSNRVPKSFDEASLMPDDMAFLQYTSGSTGDPKGVMISFSALSTNVQLFHNAFNKGFEEDGGMPSEVAGFTWLPQYHDLGLVYALLTPFAAGWRMHAMSPITFMQDPLLWLKLMSKLRVTFGVAPDFAYHLVARRFEEARNKAGGQNPIPGLDLASLSALQNCAESIQLTTHKKFSELFTEYGLRANWFGAGYGLAENVVGVSWLHEHHLSVPREENEKAIVASGARKNFDPSLTLKIVDPDTFQEVDDEITGEIWIAGGSKAKGYFNKPQLTGEVFHATIDGDTSGQTYLRTGDLAFFQDDYLFICGRIKDLIIYNGVNYYPHDIEFAVQDASPAVRPGCVAAFSREEAGSDGELEIVFEIRKALASKAANVCLDVQRAVIQSIGLPPTRVVAISERTICKTTSGKIQRNANRTKLHGGNHRIIFEVSDIVSDGHSSSLNDTNKIGVAEDVQGGAQTLNTIIVRFFGADYDPDKTWDELGLSSMVAVELRQSISDNFAVSLPADCFDRFSTPEEFKSYVLSNMGCPFSTKLPRLETFVTTRLSWLRTGLLQTIGVVSLLLLFAVPIIPAWWAGKMVSRVSTVFAVGGRWVKWMWLPIVIPVWMLSFTLVVIITKWVVVGKYHEGEMRTPSIAYLRWWYVDRLMHMWEFWVGRFMRDTLLLPLVYILLGARIHPTVQLKSFIREFDLVQISKRAVVEYKIGCRVFAPWERNEVGPTIRFRSVCISKDSTVKGFLCPGTSVGKGAIVEALAVVPEGAQVPDRVVAYGNPAFNGGSAVPRTSGCSWWQPEPLKLLWLFVELYMFFGLMLIGQMTWNGRLPHNWHYTPLCYWFLLIAQSSILLVVTSIALKWILVGKRRPGPYRETLWRTFSDWVADYHYQVGTMVLYSVTICSRMWNVILKCHGMDIDMSSFVFADSVVPSNVDLISIKCSFASYVMFETRENEQYHRTMVTNGSTIGRHVHIGPGLTVSGANISPFTDVTTDAVQEKTVSETLSTAVIARYEACVGLFYIFFIFCILVSFIPSYEIWFLASPSSAAIAVPTLAAALLVATLSAQVLLRAIQHAACLVMEKNKGETWRMALYFVALTATVCAEWWTFSFLCWGTPMFNVLARLFGAKVEGRMLFMGHRFCDPTLITFADRTIVDDSVVNGHYAMYKEMVLGPCRVSGVLHPRTYAMANTVVKNKESGPLRSLVPSGSRFDAISGNMKDDANEKIASCV